MSKIPQQVEIRGYQAGFGDCFLLSFIYSENEKKHVLIDFGTSELPKGLQPSEHMPRIAEKIRDVCGGHLTAVVATHRHSDHISGFGTDDKTGKSGKIIKSLCPKVVIQPWTEDPKAARDASKATTDSSRSSKSFIAGLAAMHKIADAIATLTKNKPVWMGPVLHKELRFIGMTNIANKSAVQNLIAMGSAEGATAVWAHHGSNPELEQHLPGVKVHVLGPPDLTQTQSIKQMRSKNPDEFWHLLAGFKAGERADIAGLQTERKAGAKIPSDARWFRTRLDLIRGQQLLEIVRSLDDQMNNTSIILLFEVFGKKLLFPGDAQIENWSWALQDAPDHEATLKLLSQVDVYKVGHHGSLNATPKKLLWGNLKKRGQSKGKLITLLSTMPGKHGNAKKGTEVPRKPLLQALTRETKLANTNDLHKDEDCFTVIIKP